MTAREGKRVGNRVRPVVRADGAGPTHGGLPHLATPSMPQAPSESVPSDTRPPGTPVLAGREQRTGDQTLAASATAPEGSDVDATIGLDAASESGEIARAMAAANSPDPLARYEDFKLLGEGGMGKVFLVSDRILRRQVALKVVRAPIVGGSDRFLAEALIMGRLEHPNIVPVHEFGVDLEGQPFYTMRYVPGLSLREALDQLAAGDAEARRTYTLTRLVQILLQVARGIEHAHACAVLHQDLKPANVMLGEHGEVQILDWGMARLTRTAVDESASQAMSQSPRGGSPHYMAPEQIRHNGIDQRADVYALGVMLYEILTLRVPFEGTLAEVFSAHLKVEPAPPRLVASEREVPIELQQICLTALSKSPDQRQQTARDFHDAVQDWLEAHADKGRRRERAADLAQRARGLLADYLALQDQVRSAAAQATEMSKQYGSWLTVDDKRALFEAEDRVAHLKQRLLQAASETVATATRALGFDPEDPSARETLADYYWMRFQDAETRLDREVMAFFADLVATYHDGKYARELKGDGSLALTSDPSGAEVWLHDFEERDLRLQPVRPRLLGTTPVQPVPLAMGSYLVRLRHPGYRDVDYPVAIGRNREWVGRVRMYTDAELGADMLYIPGGPYASGGDTAPGVLSPPRSERQVDDVFVARHPVTMAEYLEFIHSLDGIDPAMAEARSPRQAPRSGSYLVRSADGRLQLPEVDAEGDAWNPRFPVFGVSLHDGQAYCRWRSERDGRPYRLLTDAEWEKAARGTDGRWYPWGNRFDTSLCNVRGARAGRTAPAAVEDFPTDCSVYGVRGLAGNVRTWTSTVDDSGDDHRQMHTIRGGVWGMEPLYARSTFKDTGEASLVKAFIGLRVACDPPAAASVQHD